MQEKEFNLLDEPWIRVITPSLEQKEVSLTDALIHAHEYKGLSGEMPTQDAAVLRVLLAAAVTCFYRYDACGRPVRLVSGDEEEDELEDEEEEAQDADDDAEDADEEGERTVLRRWQRYWKKGKFPEQAVREYLETWRERFWLFHPKTPFWQVKDLQYGTDYGVECLFGNIKESNNGKTRHHFSMTEGEELNRLGYGEAACWLVHLNAYAVNVKTDKEAPGMGLPVGVGRLGQLGFVMVNGENLFQILMLNLCARNTDKDIWAEPKPVWEQAVRTGQGCEREEFDNLPELYTIQSRRIMLKRDEGGGITGFRAMGGDFCPVEDAFCEPMTIWKSKKEDKKKDQNSPHFLPQEHDPAVRAWREFPALLDFGGSEDEKRKKHIPGVVQWIQTLYSKKLIPSDHLITFRMIGMIYGDQMKYTYGDCVNDSLTLSADLLAELNGVWRTYITDQVEKCQAVAKEALYHAANKFCKLLYGDGSAKSGIREALVGQYYFSIDAPFREWLVSIKPTSDSPDEKQAEWEKQSYYYARKTVEDYISTLGADLYLNREEEIKGGRKRLLTIPGIMNEYLWELKKIYNKTDNAERGGRK